MKSAALVSKPSVSGNRLRLSVRCVRKSPTGHAPTLSGKLLQEEQLLGHFRTAAPRYWPVVRATLPRLTGAQHAPAHPTD